MTTKPSKPGGTGGAEVATEAEEAAARSGQSNSHSESEHAGSNRPGRPAARRQPPEAILDWQVTYKDLFESANAVILMADAQADILDINHQGEVVTGYSREELIGRNVLRDLIIPEDREAMTGVLQNLLHRENQTYEVHWHAKDGRVIALEGSSSARFSADDEFISTRCILHDITTRKRAEESLRLTQFSVDHAAEAVFWVGEDAHFTYANLAACRRLGYSPDELRRMTVHDIDPDFPPEVWPEHWRRLKREGSFVFESRHRAKDGRIIPVELTVNHLEFEGREYNCAFARDITERKRAEENLRKAYAELETRVEQRTAELERSNADLQQFAYAASHDLQEPLRMMGAYLQALEQDSRERLDEQTRNFIRLSLDAAARMQQLINALLEYARVGACPGQFESVDANAVVDQVVADLGETISREEAEVSHETLPTLTADPTLLGQLFQNLIANGVKFHGQEPPRVHVSAEDADEEWVFSVKDNGIGIEAGNVGRVFAAFERVHSSDEYSGTGIGLAICKRVVQRHGGRIWCDSTPGAGSTFHFSIPK